MKKILVVLLSILAIFSLVGCKAPEVDKLSESISFSHEKSFIGENEECTAIIEVGNKEEVFVDDGKVGNIVPFTKVLIIPKNKNIKDSVNVTMLVDGKDSKITLTRDMFTGNFEKTIKSSCELTKIVVNEKEIALKDDIKDCINRDSLMKIIKSELKQQIDEGFKDNEFTKELYIKLVRNNNDIKGESYWYVALIDGKNSFSSLLIDSKTGKVLSKKLAM